MLCVVLSEDGKHVISNLNVMEDKEIGFEDLLLTMKIVIDFNIFRHD